MARQAKFIKLSDPFIDPILAFVGTATQFWNQGTMLSSFSMKTGFIMSLNPEVEGIF
jgi:hypothetical protein